MPVPHVYGYSYGTCPAFGFYTWFCKLPSVRHERFEDMRRRLWNALGMQAAELLG